MIVRFLASRGSYELGISPFCGPGVATPCRTQKYQNRRESPWVDFLGPPPRPVPGTPPPQAAKAPPVPNGLLGAENAYFGASADRPWPKSDNNLGRTRRPQGL